MYAEQNNKNAVKPEIKINYAHCIASVSCFALARNGRQKGTDRVKEIDLEFK